jgi:HPr kinase/phosphorylase
MNTDNKQTIHGVFMDIFGLGVLLQGESGIGKSEIALGLISRGHRLIADDSIDLYLNDKAELAGKCPELLKDFLEVRGLGILNIRAMFGDNAIRDHIPVRLIANLIDVSDQEIKQSNRLYGMHNETVLLGKTIPQVAIPVGPGRNLSVLLETAVRTYRLRLAGYDAALDFIDKQKTMIQQGE